MWTPYPPPLTLATPLPRTHPPDSRGQDQDLGDKWRLTEKMGEGRGELGGEGHGGGYGGGGGTDRWKIDIHPDPHSSSHAAPARTYMLICKKV